MSLKLILSGAGKSDGIELGGKLYVKINGLSVYNVSTLMDDPMHFFSLESECENVYYLCESTLSEKKAKVTHRINVPTDTLSLSTGFDKADIFAEDAVHQECIFTRRINTKTKTEFRLVVPKSCDTFFYQSYKLASRTVNCVMIAAGPGAPTLDGGVNPREQRMLILMLGAISYDPVKMTFVAQPGESGLAFISGDFEKFSRLGKLAISYFEENQPSCLPTEKRILMNLKSRSINGAIFPSPLDRRIHIEDFPDTVKAFALSGDTESAEKEILRVCDLSCAGARFAPFYPWQSDKSDPVSALYFVYGVKQYFDICRNKELYKKVKPILKSAITLAIREQRGGMLPEIATSFCYETGVLSEEARHNGSAVTSSVMAECLMWMRDLCTADNGEDFGKSAKVFKRELDSCLEAFCKHMISLKGIAHNCPMRDTLLRRERFIYGRCLGCIENMGHVYEGFLERSCKGVYLCPKCYGTYNTALVFRKSNVVFTAWAAVWAAKSQAIRKCVGEKKLLAVLEPYFEAYKDIKHQRATKEDAYMLEAAVYLDQRTHAKNVYSVLIKNQDVFGGFGKYSDANGCTEESFHAGAAAAVYNALKLYEQYEKDGNKI